MDAKGLKKHLYRALSFFNSYNTDIRLLSHEKCAILNGSDENEAKVPLHEVNSPTLEANLG
jgi:hypothetical protein